MTIIDKNIDVIKNKLSQMTFHCEKSLLMVEKALVDHDINHVNQIVENDLMINQLEHEIESLSHSVLIRQQPVASHFKIISTILKIIDDLERIGDYAKEISIILNQYDIEDLKYKRELIALSKDVRDMLVKSINAFLNQDMKQAQFVIHYDSYVDKSFNLLKQRLSDDMVFQKDINHQILDIYMIGKYYERCGDRCVNIAKTL